MGCYNEHEKEYPVKWRKEVEKWFKDNCENPVKIINPTDFYRYDLHNHKTEKEIMRFELNAIEKCNVVLANLRDLNKSIGTSDEIKHSYDHSIPVIGFLTREDELSENELKSFVHPWKIEQMLRIETGKEAMINAMKYIKEYYIDY